VPSLLSPESGALTSDYTPRLDWGDSSVPAGTTFDHYELQVSTRSAFNALLLDQALAGPANSEYTFLSDLAPNARYYWRVRAFNTLGQSSNWSASRYFRAAMLPPVAVTPADGATLVNRRPTFDWQDVTGASTYTIQISRYSNFSTILASATVAASTYRASTDLPSGVILYWRIRANGPNGPSLWATARWFRIQ
jgi:predicted phage tail protein